MPKFCFKFCYLQVFFAAILRAQTPSNIGSISGRGSNFPFSTATQTAVMSTQPPAQLVPDAFATEVKWPEREAE